MVIYRIFALLVAALSLPAMQAVNVTATRLAQQPLLQPGQFPWTEAGVFNPTAIKLDAQTILLFRAQDRKGTSRIGFAASSDGLHFKIRPEPVLSPDAAYEKNGGVEDPRVVAIGGTYYLTYTGYDGLVGFWTSLWEAWEQFRPVIEEVIELGHDRFITVVLIHAQGKGSGIEVIREATYVYEISNDKLVYMALFFDHENALTHVRERES